MARDPACLFYWGDWSGGTATFSRHQKGCYMDLLNAQFNNGPLSLDEIKTVLGSDFGQTWPTIQKKFKFENDRYFNERLQAEKDKRSAYVASRKGNLTKNKSKPMDSHMDNGNGIGSVNGEEVKEENQLPHGPLFAKAWDDWCEHRKQKRAKLTTIAINRQLAKLSRFTEQVAIAVIERSITNGWTGLFDPPDIQPLQNKPSKSLNDAQSGYFGTGS